MGKYIRLKALKYPDRNHYEWEGELLEQTDDYVIVLCRPGRRLVHYTKNKVFTIDNTSLEIFFLKEWHTVAIGLEQGRAVSYYCNVAMPSVLDGDELRFVDLDLDLVQGRDEPWKVVDEDEFEANSETFRYPPELKDNAVQALARLKAKVEKGEFPFHADVLRAWPVTLSE
ncbi:DUF402 domain-containing protein [Paenibacillus arenilitoris]|uniref:DUF402 domain-containing protein n=1 Tax=Paenibacillus arenilitoris TaxID=2772299 RepID=A0A927CLK6_9BACL|nr:DUF402 domain-containing protein [Paenibacillus arenilitoris]MBD2869047.1 DUF402 domain-containing protein [Paenibacillus arenilitoris]